VEVSRLKNPEVGRHLIAALQQYHISGDHILRSNPLGRAIPYYGRLQRKHLGERFDRALGLLLLDKPYDRVDDYDRKYHARVDVVSQGKRHDSRPEQHHHKGIGKLRQQHQQVTLAFNFGHGIGAVFLDACFDLGGGEARLDARAEMLDHLWYRHGVPV